MGLNMDSARIHRLLGAVNDKIKTLIDEVRKIATTVCYVACTLFRRLFVLVFPSPSVRTLDETAQRSALCPQFEAQQSRD